MRKAASSLRRDGDRDLLGRHHRIERDVQVVTQHQLQRVLARRQRQRGFGLALAEVPDVVGGRQRHAHVLGQVGVDQQVVVAGVLDLDAGGRDAHAREAEHHGDRPLDAWRRLSGLTM